MQINRTGFVIFSDASLHVVEDFNCNGYNERAEWEKKFKSDVFKRVIQQLHRLGWKTVVPNDMVERYGRKFAEDHRYCVKGDLQGKLSLSGRTVDFKMWQDVANIERADGRGEYEFNKEDRMPYLIKLEMQRTRNRINHYLCNVFEHYTFKSPNKKIGVNGVTALAWIGHETMACSHYDPATGRRRGDDLSYNNKSADGCTVRHGDKVYFVDRSGRIGSGTAYYNINNMWWVITSKYDLRNIYSGEIYVSNPGNLKVKRNSKQRRARLEGELSKAIKVMNFSRAGVIRDLLFPENKEIFVVKHVESGTYHRPNFQGYTHNLVDAGKFTSDEVAHYRSKLNQVISLVEVN